MRTQVLGGKFVSGIQQRGVLAAYRIDDVGRPGAEFVDHEFDAQHRGESVIRCESGRKDLLLSNLGRTVA